MCNTDIDIFELFLDKLSSIVLDIVTNEEIMEMVNDEVYWGGDPYHYYFSVEDEKEIKEQEEIYNEFLEVHDESYFKELAEIEEIKREIFMVA